MSWRKPCGRVGRQGRARGTREMLPWRDLRVTVWVEGDVPQGRAPHSRGHAALAVSLVVLGARVRD